MEEKAKAYADKIKGDYYRDPFSEINLDGLGRECRDAYLAGATEALAGQWHTVEELIKEGRRLIGIGDRCLCYNKDLEISFMAIYRGMSGLRYGPSDGDYNPNLSPTWEVEDEDYCYYDIDLWMPIPEPPKDGSK